MAKRISKESLMETFAARQCRGRGPSPGTQWAPPKLVAGLLQHDVRARALRRDVFDADVINDSSWPLLQDLYAAYIEGTKMRTKQLCATSGLPQTTVLRYLDHLEKCNVVRRESDPADQRVTLVSITEAGLLWMCEYYARLVQAEQMLATKGAGIFSLS